MFRIIQHRKIYLAFSSLLVLASIVVLSLWGLKLGIDFTGGSLAEISFEESRPDNQAIKEVLAELELGEIVLQPAGEKGLLIRMKAIGEPTHQAIVGLLNQKFGQIEEKRFESIGPTIGQELRRKALWAMGIVLIAILLYIAWVFRRVSKPVASWKYGLSAVLALAHNILIVLGVFSVLGHFWQMEVGTPFIAALLTILGYSVNDTIVVFDRTRENLFKAPTENFEEIVNQSVNQTIVRSLNTSLTTLFVLSAIYFLGGETIKYFALALIIGVIVGTYSSIFMASPLLVVWQRWKEKKG